MPFTWLKTCSFMKGMSQKSVRFQACLPPIKIWAVMGKLVNLITYVFFLHFCRPPLWKMVRRICCSGSQFLPSNNQVCKKKSPNKELTRIFDFQLAALALEPNLLFWKIFSLWNYQGNYVDKFCEKCLWMNWMS